MKKKMILIGGVALLSVSAVAFYQSLVTVTWDDLVVTKRAKVIDGTLYAPVKDIADAYKAQLEFDASTGQAKITSDKIVTVKSGDTVKAGQWFSVDGVVFMVGSQIGFSDLYGWMVKGQVRNDLKQKVQVQLEWNPGPHYIESISSGEKAECWTWSSFDRITDDLGNSINDKSDTVGLASGKRQPFTIYFSPTTSIPQNAADCRMMLEIKTMLNESEMNFKSTRVFVTFAR